MSRDPSRPGAALASLLFALTLLAACGGPPGGAGGSAAEAGPRKNVLLVTFDALRQDHLSLNGYPRPTTPTIDRLAAEGVVLRDVVPTSCSTKGSLTSLFISRDLREHGMTSHGGVLGDDYVTLAEVFRGAGYATAGFVATPHLAAEMGYGQGFDVYEDFTGSRHAGVEYVDAGMVAGGIRALLDRRQPGGRPFFIYAHFEEPHPPWHHPSPWLADDAPELPGDQLWQCTHVPTPEEWAAVTPAVRQAVVARYDGALRYADARLGEVLESLRLSGALADTVVAVSTDHGLELLDRYSATHGYNPYDEVVRGFLVLWDGGRPLAAPPPVQGRIYDVGPTLLARADLAAPAEWAGFDLLDPAAELPELAFTACYNGLSVRSLTEKLVVIGYERGTVPPPTAPAPGVHFYDLAADPGETRDLATETPERLSPLRREVAAYRRDFLAVSDLHVRRDEELSPETRERLRSLGYIQ